MLKTHPLRGAGPGPGCWQGMVGAVTHTHTHTHTQAVCAIDIDLVGHGGHILYSIENEVVIQSKYKNARDIYVCIAMFDGIYILVSYCDAIICL